jgi:hypothetical protein
MKRGINKGGKINITNKSKILNPITGRFINKNGKKGKFFNNFNISKNKLFKLLEKSPIDFEVIEYKDLNRIEIYYTLNKIGKILGYYDLRRLACKSEFYKYVINVNNFISKNTQYFAFEFPNDLSIWKGFKEECKNYQIISNKDLKKKIKLINKLPNKYLNYIKNNFNIDN